MLLIYIDHVFRCMHVEKFLNFQDNQEMISSTYQRWNLRETGWGAIIILSVDRFSQYFSTISVQNIWSGSSNTFKTRINSFGCKSKIMKGEDWINLSKEDVNFRKTHDWKLNFKISMIEIHWSILSIFKIQLPIMSFPKTNILFREIYSIILLHYFRRASTLIIYLLGTIQMQTSYNSHWFNRYSTDSITVFLGWLGFD